jgi:hypothetical protein
MGAPVAFLPVPAPQTDLVADAVPEPTTCAVPAPMDAVEPIAAVVAISARRLTAAAATPILIFVDLIRFLL